MDFVEICKVCTRKVIIKAAKMIFNSDKIFFAVIVISILASLFWLDCGLWLERGRALKDTLTVICSSFQPV